MSQDRNKIGPNFGYENEQCLETTSGMFNLFRFGFGRCPNY